ncbi:winged helix-turn-helix transcriptional regulator [Pedobacter sp. PAMC26386]|nr:winged helix-turn-helix transcriptional regulator [Pedobacter sp. PAMC26386]
MPKVLDCGQSIVVKVLGGKWKEEVSQRAIYKVAHAEIPLHVEYFFTESGLKLLPILTTMEVWG